VDEVLQAVKQGLVWVWEQEKKGFSPVFPATQNTNWGSPPFCGLGFFYSFSSSLFLTFSSLVCRSFGQRKRSLQKEFFVVLMMFFFFATHASKEGSEDILMVSSNENSW
jgi:hypothetical protein